MVRERSPVQVRSRAPRLVFRLVSFINGLNDMAKKDNRVIVTLCSTESAHRYTTTKNKTNNPGRIEFKKYDPVVRRHVLYKESK